MLKVPLNPNKPNQTCGRPGIRGLMKGSKVHPEAYSGQRGMEDPTRCTAGCALLLCV